MSKEKEKVHNCSHCGHKLSHYEIADNIYAGLAELDYVCYSCQSYIENDDPDDEGKDFGNENYWE